MITAETVNRILKFHGDGLPVVSLYGRIDPGASPREVHTRMMSLLDQVRPLAKDHGARAPVPPVGARRHRAHQGGARQQALAARRGRHLLLFRS